MGNENVVPYSRFFLTRVKRFSRENREEVAPVEVDGSTEDLEEEGENE